LPCPCWSSSPTSFKLQFAGEEHLQRQGGVGMNLDKDKEWHVELGYMHQPNFDGSPETNDKSRLNHALRITLTSDAPFKRK